jgi:hypothetical protein
MPSTPATESMKRAVRIGAVLAGLAALAGCVSRTAAPAPPPAPPAPPSAPEPPPPLPAVSWEGGTLTPGDWSYVEGPSPRATFGDGVPVLAIQCTGGRRIELARQGASAGSALVVRTTFGDRALPASAGERAVAASLAADDPLLDQIAFSRGRILVHLDGATDIVVPTWPEPARVIEECRGQ